MTLIAGIHVGKNPILLGDLLISSKIAPKEIITLPTIGELNINQPGENSACISGVSQKICILNDRISVAWSGSRIIAKHIIKEMKDHFSCKQITREKIEEFISSQNKREVDQLSLIILYVNKQGLFSYGLDTTDIETPEFGHCKISGSGTGEFIEFLYLYTQYKQSRDDITPLSMSIGRTLGLASGLIGYEMAVGANLDSYYGGGLEIASYIEGRFQKIGDILHAFWIYDPEEDPDRIDFSPFIYKLDYWKDYLVIRRINLDHSAGQAFAQSYNIFVVEPLVESKIEKNLTLSDLPDLNAQYFSNTILIRNQSERIRSHSTVHYSPGRDAPLKIDNEKEGISIYINESFFQSEIKNVRDSYKYSPDIIGTQE